MSRARDGAKVGGSKPGMMREEQGTRPARLDGFETRRRRRREEGVLEATRAECRRVVNLKEKAAFESALSQEMVLRTPPPSL